MGLLPDNMFPMFLTGSAGVLTILSLALGTVRKEHLHSTLAERYSLLGMIFADDRSLTDEQYSEVFRKHLELEAGSPPTLRLLDAQCHYEVLRSLGGDPKKIPHIPPLRRALIHVMSQSNYAKRLPSSGEAIGSKKNPKQPTDSPPLLTDPSPEGA